MSKMFDPSTYNSAQLACVGSTKIKYEIENPKRVNEGKMEGFNTVDMFQIEIGLNQWPSDLGRNTQENVCRIPAVTLYYIPEE